jgi:GDP-L-fucose synthase
VNKDSKIYIAGHTGMVGSSILRRLIAAGYSNLVFTPYPEYDLIDQKTVSDFFKKEQPEYVIDSAARVGGIQANNTYRAEFIYQNLAIQNNLIHSAYREGVKKFLFLGSSCIYPRECPQPIKEEYLLTGILEKTNEPYAIAKIAGIKMCENYFRQYGSNFISVMPTNLYGPGDNYDLESSHVIPALIRKFHEAKMSEVNIVEVWGTGAPKREFLFVDDMADACVFMMEQLEAEILYESGVTHINIGSGIDLSIGELAKIIAEVVGFSGDINFDTTRPDGTPRKLLDVSRLNHLGWESSTNLRKGLEQSYQWFRRNG